MKMNHSLKRVLSFLLVAVMVIGMCPLSAFAATDVTLTFKNGAAQDAATRYLIYFETLSDTADKYWNNNIVYIDGEEVSGVHYTHLSGGFALLVPYDLIEAGVTTASGMTQSHMLHIKSGTALANGEYSIANDVWLKLDKTSITQYSPVDLSLAKYGAQDFATRFQLTFSGFADTTDKYWNGNTVYVDGQAVSGTGVHYLPNSDDTIALYLSYSVLEADVTTASSLGSHILEIPAGTILGNTYVVNKSVKLQISGATVTQIYDPDVTVTLSNDSVRNTNGSTSGVYFYVSPADDLASDVTNWTVRYPMTTGGIYVNDVLVPGAKLIKLTANLYYVSVEGCGITYSAGDVVTVSGTVTSDGYTVAYTEESFQYQGNGNWDIYVPVEGTSFALDESDPGGWQGGDLNRYLIWLSDDISGEKTALGTVQLLVDGEEKSVSTALISGRYALLLNADCGITEKGEHSVKITAGQSLGEYTALNDVVIYTHANGGVDTVAPKIVTLGVNGGAWQGDQSRYLIWLTDDITDTKAEVGSISATVNGESSTASVALLNGTYALLLTASNGITAMGEHSVQIAAGQKFGSYIVKNDLTIYTHNDGTINTTAPKYVTLGVNGGAWQGDQSRYLIWLTDDITDTKGEVGSISVIVNGESTTASVALLNGTYALLLTASNGITAMGEHSIQITAGQKFGGYIVNNDLTIYTHSDGTINTTAPKYVTLGFSSGTWQVDQSRYLVYLTDDISGDKVDVGGITALVDGESKTVSTALINGEYLLVLNENCGISTLDEHYIQITAGQMFGSYIVNNDLTIYTHADGTVNVKEPTIEVPADRYVTLTVKDENGQTVMNRAVAWNADSIALTEQELKASVADGQVLLGYVYGDALYASIANINTEEMTELEITLDTLDFAVHSELRHGNDLADSGLRFVAALSDPSYSKVLLIADSEDKLNAENADYKVGDAISADFKQITAMDGAVCYSLALTNIPAADYSKTYYAAGAILVTYADGTEGYVYTDAVASTVNEAAGNSHIASDSKKVYTDGVIHLDAKANPVGSYSYTAQASNDANGDYVITYTGTQKVEALTVVGQRFTAADGVQFGDGTITIPATLFANALLQEELAETNKKLQIGAYRGPAIGQHTYTDSDGAVTDCSITRTHDEVYADLEDFFAAGFNIWMAEEWIYGASNFGENDALSALDLAAEYCINHGLTGEDIQVLITDSLLNGLLEGYTMPTNAGSTVAEYAQIISNRVNILKNYNPKVNGVEVGTEYNCFAGYILRDEPFYDHLEYYNGWFSFLAADTDQTIDVIANSASTGGQVSGTVNALGMLADGYTLYFSMISNGAAKKYVVSGSSSESACTTAEYTAYLKKFVDGVNSTVWNYSNMVLTTDSYGLNTYVASPFGDTSATSTNLMNEYWQESLALVASLVEEKNPDATFATVLRSFGMTRLYMMAKASTWYNSVSWTEYKKFDAAWGQQAMDLQAYTTLAHGYTYMSYFTYWETQHQSYTGETFTDACVMWDDNMNPVKQNMYYWVKNTNAELRALENLIGNFSYNDTAAIAAGSSYYAGTEGLWTAAQLADNTAIASVSVSEDTTVGYYTKDEGNFGEMFILVNMSHPEEGSSDTVTVTFDSGYTGAIVYIDGEATMVQLTDGACTITIPSGEGVVVIPAA